MSVKTLANRLDKLGGGVCRPEDCDEPACVVIDDGVRQVYLACTVPGAGPDHRHVGGKYGDDGRLLYDPATAPRCPKCGASHVSIIREVVVMDRAAVLAMRALPPGYDGPLPPGCYPSGIWSRNHAETHAAKHAQGD